jgi:DNA-binding MarR family transcriptional regulator
MSSPADTTPDFGILLGLAYQAFVDQLHAELARHGFHDLGPSVGYVVRAIAGSADPMSQRQLAEYLGVTDQGAAKIVDDLVARDFIRRRPSPDDARVNHLHLSARGKELLAVARRFHARFEAGLVRRFGGEAAATRRVLTAIAASADERVRGRLRAV